MSFPVSIGAAAPHFSLSSSLHSPRQDADGPVHDGGSPPPASSTMAATSRSDMWVAIVHAVGRQMGIPASDFLSPAEIIKSL